jgi:type I restriction enzyme S subunit
MSMESTGWFLHEPAPRTRSERHAIVRSVNMLFERADAIDREVVAESRRCERLTGRCWGRRSEGKI